MLKSVIIIFIICSCSFVYANQECGKQFSDKDQKKEQPKNTKKTSSNKKSKTAAKPASKPKELTKAAKLFRGVGLRMDEKYAHGDHVTSKVIKTLQSDPTPLLPKQFRDPSQQDVKDISAAIIAILNREFSQKLFYGNISQLIQRLNDWNRKKTGSNKEEQITEQDLKKFLSHLGVKKYENLLKLVVDSSSKLDEQIKEFLVDNYIKTIQNNSKSNKDSIKTNPAISEILQTINSNEGMKIERAKFNRVALGEGKRRSGKETFFPNGEVDMKEAAKAKNSGLFKNFLDINTHYENAVKLKKGLQKGKYRGVLVTSVIPGVDIREGFFSSLVRIAKDKKLAIVIIPSNRDAEFLPKVLEKTEGKRTYYMNYKEDKNAETQNVDGSVKELNDIEGVHVLTNNFDLSQFVEISAIPIYAKNLSPFASLQRLHKKNQVTIVGHPQLQAKVLPTDNNQNHPTIFLSSGSISENNYPYNSHHSGRLSEIAKSSHSNGAWIFEIPDKNAGPLERNPEGLFHFYPIYNHEFNDAGDGISYGTIGNRGQVYRGGMVEAKAELEYIILGDLHIGGTNKKVYAILDQIVKDHPEVKNIVIHDFFDGESINHHEEHKVVKNADNISKNLTLKEEYNENVRVLNGLLAKYPDITFHAVVSNHPNWLEQKIQDGKSYIKDLNSEFFTEIRFAVEQLNKSIPGGVSAIEYLFNYRKAFLAVSQSLPSLQEVYEKEEIFINHPERLHILKPGEALYGGHEQNRVILHAHGHNFKGKQVGPSVAHNVNSAVIGHTHAPSITGELVNVGTSTDLTPGYTRENMASDWVQGFALLYKNASHPILHMIHPLLHKWRSTTSDTKGKPGPDEIQRRQGYFKNIEIGRNDNDENYLAVKDQFGQKPKKDKK